MDDRALRDLLVLRDVLASLTRTHCVPARAAGRTLVGRPRRVVPVAALRGGA